jgi:signal transduction histidine kinase
VTICRRHDDLLVEIADDGVGGPDPAGGSGLRGVAERGQALGGRLAVSSPPACGTTVRAEFPLAVARRAQLTVVA